MDPRPRPPRPRRPFPYASAAVASVLMVTAELVLQVFSDTLGWALGGLAAGLVLFTLSPLQLMADRRMHEGTSAQGQRRAMSAAQRKALYLAQARVAWSDQQLSVKERMLLDDLRNRLGIPLEDADRLERQALEQTA